MTQDPERLAEKLEERIRATEAEAAAMAAKIEDHMTITEAAAYVRSTLKPSSECRPTHQEILTTAKNRWHVSGLDYSPQQYAEWLAKECRVLQADQSWFKPEPEVDEATLVKVDQTVLGIGNPRANCFQACLAMLSGLPLEDVIDVTDPLYDEDWVEPVEQWALSHGWQFKSGISMPKDRLYIANGPTAKREGRHGVVCFNGDMLHDPHPSRDGIVSVDYYCWLERAVIAEALAKRPRVEADCPKCKASKFTCDDHYRAEKIARAAIGNYLAFDQPEGMREAIRFMKDALDELRAEWEVKRPRVDVPEDAKVALVNVTDGYWSTQDVVALARVVNSLSQEPSHAD